MTKLTKKGMDWSAPSIKILLMTILAVILAMFFIFYVMRLVK